MSKISVQEQIESIVALLNEEDLPAEDQERLIQGADKAVLVRLNALTARFVAENSIARTTAAQQRKEALRERLQMVQKSNLSRDELILRIQGKRELLGSAAPAFFRSFLDVTDEDLASHLADLEFLDGER